MSGERASCARCCALCLLWVLCWGCSVQTEAPETPEPWETEAACVPFHIRALDDTSSAGVFPDRIVVGTTLPLTGPQRASGVAMRDGLRAHLEHVNRRGGVYGRRVELVVYDDRGEPERATQNIQEMLGDGEGGVFAVIGGVVDPTYYGSTDRFAVLLGPRVARGIPRFGGWFGVPTLNVFPTYQREGEVLGRSLVERDVSPIRPRHIAFFGRVRVRRDASQLRWDDLEDGARRAFLGLGQVLKQHELLERTRIPLIFAEAETDEVDEQVERLIRWLAFLREDTGDAPWRAAVLMHGSGALNAAFVRGVRAELDALRAGGGRTREMLSAEELTWVLACSLELVTTSFDSEVMARVLRAQGDGQARCVGVRSAQAVPMSDGDTLAAKRYREELRALDPDVTPTLLGFQGHITARMWMEGLRRAGEEVVLGDLFMLNVFWQMFHERSCVGGPAELGLGEPLRFDSMRSVQSASTQVWMTELDASCQHQAYGVPVAFLRE